MADDWIGRRGWIRPDHGGACFASIPGTIVELLTGGAPWPALPSALLEGLESRYERVVFVYLDAFGHDVAERHRTHPLLARAAREGRHERITSQFPSTTAAHMTTIHTGLPVGEHGVYEWHVLEPELDRLIAPLPFAFAGEGQGALPEWFGTERVYPAPTLHERLAAAGVRTILAGPALLRGTATSNALLRGSDAQIGYTDVGDGLSELARALRAAPWPTYGFAYIDSLDTMLHRVGPLHPAQTQVDAEVRRLLDAVEQRLLAELPAGTLLLLSSDHGMSAVSPQTTIYLNEGDVGDAIRACLRGGAEPDGHPLAPAGSCRDVFLHAQEGRLDALLEALRERVGDRAEVRTAEELIDAGLFGPSPGAALRRRLGDVAVLPALGEAVYWYTPGRFRQGLWGQHGGLTAQEMEIPLVALCA